MIKTNVMRILDKNNISYQVFYYKDTGFISGLDVCNYFNENPNQVYKTLVTVSKSKINYVFLVPVSHELDLKKASVVVNEKNIEMIPQKELLKLTGYIHGGCSPIGMKKKFKTIIDDSVNNYEEIYISGGMVGVQIKIKTNDLCSLLDCDIKNIKEN